MGRWAIILGVLSAGLAALGYTPLGGAFAELAQMLFFIAAAAFAVMAVLALGRRGRS